MSEPRFVECVLDYAGGTTTRELVEVLVDGRALLGPTRFPVLQPHIAPGERARLLKSGWAIVPQAPARRARKPQEGSK
jgi:hypothetical protein